MTIDAEEQINGQPAKAEMFSFGDPTPVLDKREFWGFIQSCWNGRYYEPPVSLDGLAKAFTATPHHESSIRYKVQLLFDYFVPHKLLNGQNFKKLALDYLVFGNCYLERTKSRMDTVMALKPTLARFTRMKKDGNGLMLIDGKEHHFSDGDLLQIMEPDINQEIYGVPSYLGALQSALLNESATLFRRKYYVNGSHAGFILYVSDPSANQEDVDSMREALKNAKGPGNFRNLFYYSPNGKKDGIQLIPISEVTAKDEFFNMKNVTRDDQLASHRMPPQLLGIVPVNAGGFGSVDQAAQVFFSTEIKPLMTVFKAINEWTGADVVTFRDYVPPVATGSSGT